MRARGAWGCAEFICTAPVVYMECFKQPEVRAPVEFRVALASR